MSVSLCVCVSYCLLVFRLTVCVWGRYLRVWFLCVFRFEWECVWGGYLRNVVLVRHTLAEEDLFQGG